jgi:hypothetical protein
LATTVRPEHALLLSDGQRMFYVTPERAADFVSRFSPE